MPSGGHAGGTLIEQALQDRFLRDWHALTGARVADRALIALSGGPDSTALLLLFAAVRASLNPPVAATVDHRLRAASSAEAGTAADLCRAAGVPHAILKGELPARSGPTANLSARARELRYALLADHADAVGARWIVTAHHADDQLETVVMRLNRGAGVGGLGAIRASVGRVVRPLLGWTRAELAAIVASSGVTAINDPSNVDARFDRARLRRQLAEAPWLDARAAARSAAACAQADEAIEWSLDDVAAAHCALSERQATLNPIGVPAEYQRRLAARCLRHVDPAIVIRGDALSRFVDALRLGRDATLGQVHAVPLGFWIFTPAPPRRTG